MNCPGCGQAIDLDESREFGFCTYCGTKVMVDKTIIEHIGSVKIDNSDYVQKFLDNARRALDKQDWEEVEKYYNLVEQNDPHNIEAVFFSSFGKVMDSFTSTDYFKREQLFAILDRSISVINDYYEVTSEDKEAVLRKILKYIYIMRKTQFVFNPNSAFRSNRDNLHFTAGLVFRTRDSFLIELKQIQEKHNEPYIAELITEIEKDKAAVSDNNSGGCYVATCVYGSYDCPQVWTLRRYRDTTLADRWYGRAFIHAYYAISPTLVKWFGETAWFKKMWKGRLDRMVKRLNENGVESTPYQDKEW